MDYGLYPGGYSISITASHQADRLERNGRELELRMEGQLTFIRPALETAIDGFGLAYLPAGYVQPWVERGALVSLLEPWLPAFDGYQLYYPSRRQMTPAFRVIVDALRYTPSRR